MTSESFSRCNMQIQIFQRNVSEYYNLRRKLMTYLMIVTTLLKENMVDRDVVRPDEGFCNGRYGIINKFCFGEFLRFCYIASSANENDWQSMRLKIELLEANSPGISYPTVIPLISSK